MKHSNETHCPVCTLEWEFCTCDELYPEQSLIEQDDQNILITMGAEKFLRSKGCKSNFQYYERSVIEFMEEYAELVAKERAIEFGRWKQYSRYELMPIDYADFMVERN